MRASASGAGSTDRPGPRSGHRPPLAGTLLAVMQVAPSLPALVAGAVRRWRAARARQPGRHRGPAFDRAAIVNDLHDVVTHRLTTMVVQADAAQTRLGGRSPETAAALAAIAASGREALAELRELLAGLEPEPHPPGRRGPRPCAADRPPPGLADLPRLLELAGPPGHRVTLSVQGEQHPLPADVQLAMYRIVQESVTNALRHSGDVPSTVTVRYGDGVVELQIDNDAPAGRAAGRGAGAAGGTGTAGRGRRGMLRRAAALGGQLTAGPRPDGGYRVLIRLPHPGPP